MPTDDNHHRGHETTDADARSLTFSGLGLLAVMAVTIALLIGALRFLETRHQRSEIPVHVLAESSQAPPAPRLQITPERDLEHYYLKEDSLLHSYGWVIREAGIARIPVDSAMAMLLRRGLPVRTEERVVKNEGRDPSSQKAEGQP
jgi:hypothetical protein